MSGTAISNWAVDKTPTETAKEVAAYQGCPVNNTVSMIKCMQKLDAAAIVKVYFNDIILFNKAFQVLASRATIT